MRSKVKLALFSLAAALLFGAPAAFGLGGATPALAVPGPGPGAFCNPPGMGGPSTLVVGQKAIYWARVQSPGEVHESENGPPTAFAVDVNLNDISGNSDITSILSEEELGNANVPLFFYHDIPATDFVDTLVVNDAFSVTAASEFQSLFQAAGPLLPAGAMTLSACGVTLASMLAADVANGDDTIDGGTGATAAGRAAALAVLQAAMLSPDFNAVILAFASNGTAVQACVTAGDTLAHCQAYVAFILDETDEWIDGLVLVDVTCTIPGNFQLSFADSDNSANTISKQVTCFGIPTVATVTASATKVEIQPADGSVSFSTITVTVTDQNGNRLDGVSVAFTTDNCWFADQLLILPLGGSDGSIRTTTQVTDTDALATVPGGGADQSFLASQALSAGGQTAAGTAEAILNCYPGGTSTSLSSFTKPGPANITFVVTFPFCAPNALGVVTNVCSTLILSPLVGTVQVTVVGPPASITVAASPTTLRCGEKSTITATVLDAIGQNVSDHTRIEAITNFGGVLGGTGAVGGSLGAGVVPLSSTIAETFGGVATLFLLTSEQTTGPYEVVVTGGGSITQTGQVNNVGGDVDPFTAGVQPPLTPGLFSTGPVSAQVTVTCALPAAAAPTAQPTVIAPKTGTGINPPNTGDAGLKDTSSSWALFAIGGLAAFALAGLATIRFARR